MPHTLNCWSKPADDHQPDTIAKHWIDGRWRDSSQHRDIVDLATGKVIGRYAIGGREEAREDRTTTGDRPREAFGVSEVFSDHEQMVTRPGIDVVAVTVKVPHHRELVSAALAAGKAVYCEWPLGRDLDDARAMAALAVEQGVRTIVGLQARQGAGDRVRPRAA